jgi:hypothetical protein
LASTSSKPTEPTRSVRTDTEPPLQVSTTSASWPLFHSVEQPWLESQAPTPTAGQWWQELSGTVTLPAASYTVKVPIIATGNTLSDKVLMDACAELETAIKSGNAALREARPYLGSGNGDTGVIETSCRDAIRLSSETPARAQSIGHIIVDGPASRDARLRTWRHEMGWNGASEPAKRMIVGVWDGAVSSSSSDFARDRDEFPAFSEVVLPPVTIPLPRAKTRGFSLLVAVLLPAGDRGGSHRTVPCHVGR